MNTWRLILNSPANGAWNMAVDEAILEFAIKKTVPPTLRLFDWHPCTLSLGHAQPIADINLEELEKRGWRLVRRPTGGRAILHTDELTYSICAHQDNPIVSGNVIESYRRISIGLLKTLELIGINADSKPKIMSEKQLAANPICFQYPSDYEITFQSKKLIGSAQARKNNGVLQHGSVPLFGDITRIIQVLSYFNHNEKSQSEVALKKRATTIEEISNRHVTWCELAEAFNQGFSEALNIKFEKDSLSDDEIKRAVKLYQNKYSNSKWTFRI